jgi:hypothetical protein
LWHRWFGHHFSVANERREAFLLAGLNDPTLYLSNAPLPLKPA